MEILKYVPQMSAELAEVYNAAVRGVPHCHDVGAEEFAEALSAAADGSGSTEKMHSEAAFVATDGARALGLVHVAVERPEGPAGPEKGLIRFLAYPRGRRGTGQALLEAGEDYLRRRGLGRVEAFGHKGRYRFYHLGCALLSDRLDHVRALLQFNGYEACCGEVFLDWPDCEPPEPAPADVEAEISVTVQPGRGKRPDVAVQATRDGEWAGSCECVSCGKYSRAEAAQDWTYTVGLNVAGGLQGRGLGRYLLRRALREARGAGYRHAAISTGWDNYRAFLFYSNYGYRVSDWTYAFARERDR